MTNLHKADLEFFEEAKRVFEENARMETHKNDEGTLIALRYGEDRDCIQVYQLGDEIAFIHQYMQPAPPLVVYEAKQPEINTRTTPGGTAGRKVVGKHMRTEEEIKRDEGLTLSILSAHPNGLTLGQIKNEIRNLGYTRWNNGSASSYLRSMIQKGLPIERVDYGRYRYVGGDDLSLKQN